MNWQVIVSGSVFGVVVLVGTLTAVPLLIFMERKVAGYIQDRIGPNRVGPWGLLQTVADGLKTFFKEDLIPTAADKPLFVLGPALSMFAAMAVLAVMPFGGKLILPGLDEPVAVQIAPGLDIGVVLVVMISSAAVYGVVLGGWASNNKYAFYGALRGAAQMLSYEVPLGLALLSVVLLTGDLRPEVIVAKQVEHGWFVFYLPGVLVIMFICGLAETNRLPFDLPESEQELVSGYFTEYSSMKFSMYFLGEYAHIIAAAALMVTLFLGGWHVPILTPSVEGGIAQTVVKLMVFTGKMLVVIFAFMWVRWTLPRFRFDQLIRLGWCELLPLTLIMLAATAVTVYLGRGLTVWTPIGNVAALALAYGCSYLKGRRTQPA